MSVTKISCLPVAGKENPYQYLMMQGLNSAERVRAISGIHDKFFGIIRTAIHQRPDYIHFDWETSYYWRKRLFFTFLSIPVLIFQVLIVKYIFRVKLIWTPHNIKPHDLMYYPLHKYIRRFFAHQMVFIRLFSERSIQRAAEEFKVSSDKFIIVAEGSYISFYKNAVGKNESLEKLKLPADKIILLYLGYIRPYKGIDHLIDAFYQELDDKYHLVLAGKVLDTVFFEQVKSKIKSGITCLDLFISDDELQYFFNAADVVVLPFNKIENSGSAILAMGFGKAIVAPALGVLPERLKQQEELLYTGSIDKGLAKLRQVDLNYLISLGQKNKEALLKHNWEDFAKYF